ncbi:DUF1361 domain-containing protein [Streptococcus sp. sy004]|uniref:DUF1361 domain-containing protein n=1 Tax=Streptococcus sp. sy004 TaxID=2600149 RepID=UPI0011B4679B|nr:DUF1361 domain-containing protein [Streptococcus sp. sy004]TWT09861.1 DUF1361 domain-containing protein [Streptococcus sp. sy004]
MKLKMSLIHLFWVVISAGIFRYMTSGPNLIWNMFLALVALDFAYLAYRTKNTFLKIVSVLLWLLFYPNTFYMLTDIIHMSFADQALWDRLSMIMFMLYVSSILFGVLSGVLSLQLIFNSLGVKNIYLRYLVITNLSFLSSFAIHIGRYARLNSWDALMNPMTVVDSMVEVVSWSALPFIAGFTFLQMMTLIFLDRE